jgi:hypothetical protein
MSTPVNSPVWDKDPDAVLDYCLDWSKWLANNEHITQSTWTPSAGVTVESTTATASVTTVWLSGGTPGYPFTIVNHIVTDQGRQDDRTITIRVRER